MLKTVFFGLGTVASCAVFLAGWGAISACENLDKTSPILDVDAMKVYDAGYLPPAPSSDEDPGTEPPDDTVQPNTVRVRLANLLQGGDAQQLCFAQAPSTTFQVATDVAGGGSVSAVAAGTISAPASVGLVTDEKKGAKFSFRVGPECATKGTQLATSPTLLPGSAVTLIIAGDPSVVEQSDPLFPAVTVANDVIAPPANATSFRAINGAVALPGFNVAIDGTTVLEGIRYGSAIAYPYSSTSGFAQVAAGIPQGSTIRLTSGTNVRNFTVPTRIRRGIAETMIVTGSGNSVSASICSDRAPSSGDKAECISLNPAN